MKLKHYALMISGTIVLALALVLSWELVLEDLVVGSMADHPPSGGQVHWSYLLIVFTVTGALALIPAVVATMVHKSRDRAEQALRDQLHFQQILMDATPVPIFFKDTEGTYLGCNHAFARFLGKPRDQIVGHTVYDIAPKDLADMYAEADRSLFASGGTQVYEGPVKSAGGLTREVIFEKAVFRRPDGSVGGMIGSVLDVTAHHEIERALLRANRGLRVLSGSNAALAHAEDEGAFLEAVCRLLVEAGDYGDAAVVLGATPETLETKATGRQVPRLSLDRARLCDLAGRLKAGEWHTELGEEGKPSWIALALAVPAPDLGLLVVQSGAFAFSDEDPVVLSDAARILSHGVRSLREGAERALNDRRLRQLSRAVTQSPAIVVITDPQANIQYTNPKFTEITGYAAEEVVGQNPRIFASGHTSEAEYAEMWATLAERGEWRGEFRNRKKNGQLIWVRASISAVRDETGRITNYVAVEEDVTERREALEALVRAKEEAELASRAKTEFLANMSHELRTPLNSVIGFSDILLAEMFGPLGTPRYLDYAADINQSGRHLLELINDVLDVARIETGGMALNERPVQVNRLIEACVRMIRERAHEAGLSIQTNTCEPPVTILADERRMKQVLINLLANAVKFTNEGGQIQLVTTVDDDGLCFQVIDNGIGIAEEDLEKVMSLFGQADGSLTRPHEGAGLGLPLSRALVELHGGSLTLQSRLGKGTTITVRLPPERIVADGDPIGL